MEIRIKDVKKTPIWAIPEYQIFLSSELNDFQKVEYKGLPPQVQKILWAAIKWGILESTDSEDFMKTFEKNFTRPAAVKQAVPEKVEEKRVISKPILPKMEEAQENLALIKRTEELKKVMEYGVNSLKKYLPSYKLSDLAIMLKLEETGKKRLTVVNLLNKLITDIQLKSLPNAANVVQSDEETITLIVEK